MLKQGFAVDTSDYDNRTALMLASVKGHDDIVAALLAAGANPQVFQARSASCCVQYFDEHNQ